MTFQVLSKLLYFTKIPFVQNSSLFYEIICEVKLEEINEDNIQYSILKCCFYDSTYPNYSSFATNLQKSINVKFILSLTTKENGMYGL